jgi:acyl dehydratase/NAD(P)-dependent dehydrogenase (short-subunit alcohol dehydrogenase family)
MTSTSTSSRDFTVSLAQSREFASLSGDFNPLHVDPIAARRTQFGSTVTHGIHLYLRALDVLAGEKLLDGLEPASLSATFNNPVLSGTTVVLKATVEGDGRKLRLSAEAAGRPAFSGVIELQPASESGATARAGTNAAVASAAVAGAAPAAAAPASATPASTVSAQAVIADAEFAAARAEDVDFPPAVTAGTVPLRMNRARLASLFPALARLNSTAWIADLLASTQVVGMRCPGMDSIFSGFKLKHTRADVSSMSYQVTKTDPRFRLARMDIKGATLAGTIETFFRPRPVAQKSMSDVLAAVPRDVFAGHRALVIGGSRGLGELTAKIVAAGGADVMITYARGKDDAERVCAEIRAAGRTCAARQYDAVSAQPRPGSGNTHPSDVVGGARAGAHDATDAPKQPAVPTWLAGERFTHVYFFASPQIAKNNGRWNQALFEQFTHIYVAAFAELVEQATAVGDTKAAIHFLYPSSVFVAQLEPGFAEYAVAKAAGEALCDQLEGKRGAHFTKPRLPRMRTDQTNALVDIGAADAFPVMLDVVRKLHAR